jgi:DeoR family glycerol-3-phosphate regulon repressor
MSLKRQSEILNVVRQQGTCSITDLAEVLAVSTETIRRNIQPLIESGAVLRFHGGIMIPEQLDEPPFQKRMQVNRDAKRMIAGMVRDVVRDGDSLILDNGTTAAYVADALAQHSRLLVVTHSVAIASRLASRNGNRVFIAGGELSEDASVFDSSAVDFLSKFQVKYAFLSVGGITRAGELVDFHLFEADFAQAAMRQAQETWAITDRSKFGREAPIKVCELSAIDVLACDGDPPPEFAARCLRAGVRIVTPGMQGPGSTAHG